MGRLRSAIVTTRSLSMPLSAAVNTSHGPTKSISSAPSKSRMPIVLGMGSTPGSDRRAKIQTHHALQLGTRHPTTRSHRLPARYQASDFDHQLVWLLDMVRGGQTRCSRGL